MKTRLGKLVNDCQNNWDEHLESVAFSIRTQRQASTKFTPFFLMFNRRPRLPLEVSAEKDIFLIFAVKILLNILLDANIEERPNRRM